MRTVVLLVFVFIAALLAGLRPVMASTSLGIAAVSSRPDTVSGGNVLVKISFPANQLLPVWVTLNGNDTTGVFRPGPEPNTWMGLVSGLQLGSNVLRVRSKSPAGDQSLQLTNYPITGPVFSGLHEQPFFCMTQNFPIPGAPTQWLGNPLDADCSVATRVDYVYRSTAATFKALPAGPSYPADLVQTTTSQGKTVPYIVRVETGTIDRAIYQTAILHDPTTESAPTFLVPPAGWNHRLIYTLGGGCVGGWYIQGTSIGNGGILEHLLLSQGYGVASSTLNVFGNNCQEVLAAESLMMVKERFIKNFGPPAFTIGYGCSGGSEAGLPISDDYPGLLDGLIMGCSFPEVTAGNILNVFEADLFLHYIQHTSLPWTNAQQVAATGYATVTTPASIGPSNAVRLKAQGGTCNAAIPVSMRFDQNTNPTGVRCDVYDHMVNIFGRDPVTGYARRPLDNVGVQYGLAALNSGAISKQQFLDLNQNIGGYDNNGNNIAGRTVGDVDAIKIAYDTGRVTYGNQGMKATPIIDYRGYVDQPENGNEVHQRYHSFSMRDRLVRANGNFDNQVMLVEDGVSAGTTGLFGDTSPVLSHALTQMDQWLMGLFADTTNAPIHDKIVNAKPVDLVDACFTNNGTVKIAELQLFQGATVCNQLYPSHSSPRMVAGEPVANDVLKCQLKPINTGDYAVAFIPTELAQLAAIFPQGVCDFSKPGVGQVPLENTWDFF
jgi:Tannase-like family of unknown function (DUF6351)